MTFATKAGVLKEIQESLESSVTPYLDYIFKDKEKAIKEQSPQQTMLVLSEFFPNSPENKTFKYNLEVHGTYSKEQRAEAIVLRAGKYKSRINSILADCLSLAQELPSQARSEDEKKQLLAVIYVLVKQLEKTEQAVVDKELVKNLYDKLNTSFEAVSEQMAGERKPEPENKQESSTVAKKEKQDLAQLLKALDELCYKRIDVITDLRKRNIIPGLFKATPAEKRQAGEELGKLQEARKLIIDMQQGDPKDLPDRMHGLGEFLANMGLHNFKKYGGSAERKNLKIVSDFRASFGPLEQGDANFEVVPDP